LVMIVYGSKHRTPASGAQPPASGLAAKSRAATA
jgi:hypothetical protein